MASSLVLKQLFASRSNLVTRWYRPVVATSSRFLSTSNSIRDCYDFSNGSPYYSANIDLFYKTVKCDSNDETSKDLKKGDKKAYIALSILGTMHTENEMSVIKRGSCDLFRYMKGCKFDYKCGDFSLRMKDAVFNLCLPQWKKEVFNKLEIRIMPAVGTPWFIRNSDGSLDNGGTYYAGDVSIEACDTDDETSEGLEEGDKKMCDTDDETSEGLEKGDKKMYMTLSLKSLKHREEAKDVIITKTRDLLQKLKDDDRYKIDNDWSMRLRDGVMNLSFPKNKAGVPNEWEIKFV